jgi:hypothetical protein
VLSSKKVTDRDLVRDEQGNVAQGELTINLSHFAQAKEITKLFPQADTKLTVSISYEEIVGIVVEGELEQNLQDQAAEAEEGEMDEEIKNTRKRRRETSSEEELLSADEREWRRREGKALDQGEAADRDYIK